MTVEIERVELENFRSFVGQHSVEFNSGLNIVQGGNGSGKTNLWKAMVYCLAGVSGSEPLAPVSLLQETSIEDPVEGRVSLTLLDTERDTSIQFTRTLKSNWVSGEYVESFGGLQAKIDDEEIPGDAEHLLQELIPWQATSMMVASGGGGYKQDPDEDGQKFLNTPEELQLSALHQAVMRGSEPPEWSGSVDSTNYELGKRTNEYLDEIPGNQSIHVDEEDQTIRFDDKDQELVFRTAEGQTILSTLPSLTACEMMPIEIPHVVDGPLESLPPELAESLLKVYERSSTQVIMFSTQEFNGFTSDWKLEQNPRGLTEVRKLE